MRIQLGNMGYLDKSDNKIHFDTDFLFEMQTAYGTRPEQVFRLVKKSLYEKS